MPSIPTTFTRRTCLVALAATLGAGGALAAPSNRYANAGTSDATVLAFLTTMRFALDGNDRATVAKLFAFPSDAWDGTRTVRLNRVSDVLVHYDAIFSPALVGAITAADPAALFSNWRGVMLGDGLVWFAPEVPNGQLLITRINAPVAAR